MMHEEHKRRRNRAYAVALIALCSELGMACGGRQPTSQNNKDAASGNSCGLTTDGGVFQIVSGQTGPGGIATDGTWAYWANFSRSGSIARAPICGGDAEVLVPNEDNPSEVAIDESSIYWVVDGFQVTEVRRAPLDGGVAETLALTPPPVNVSKIAVDDGYAYYCGGQSPTWGIVRVPKAGGQGAFVATPGCDGPLAVDSTSIYYGGGGQVWSVPKAGGQETALSGQVGSAPVDDLAIDSSWVYWATTAPPGAAARDTWVIMRTSKLGANTVTMISNEAPVAAMAVESAHLYWANEDGELRRMSVYGGSAETLVTGQFAFGIALTSKALLWTFAGEGDGGVFGLSLP